MHQVFIEGGLIRKLWNFETNVYRDHLLRLDRDSRRNRFCGAIGDDIVRTYAETTHGPDVVVHGFFVDGVLRGAADMRIARPSICRRPRPRSASRRRGKAMAWVPRCSSAPCFPHVTAASSICRSAA